MNFRPVNIFILILSVLFLTAGLTSCSYKHYKGFEQASGENISISAVYDTTFHKAVYKTVFKVFGQELSGLTIVKKIQPANTIHVVFMSQLGLKFFDIEIRPDKPDNWFHVNYLMESLNRDFIISILKTDFMLLFAKYPEDEEVTVFGKPGSEITETTVRFEKYVSSVFTGQYDDNVTGIEFRKGKSVKTTIQITPGINHPEELNIYNKKANLSLEWKEIQM